MSAAWLLMFAIVSCYVVTMSGTISYICNSYKMDGYMDIRFGMTVFVAIVGLVWVPYYIKDISRFIFVRDHRQ